MTASLRLSPPLSTTTFSSSRLRFVLNSFVAGDTSGRLLMLFLGARGAGARCTGTTTGTGAGPGTGPGPVPVGTSPPMTQNEM